MSYPFDGEARFENMSFFKALRDKIFYPILAVIVILTVFGRIPFLNSVMAYLNILYYPLIAAGLSLGLGLTLNIKVEEILAAYNEKADFEEILYKILQSIDENKSMSSEVKQALFRTYLLELRHKNGRQIHLLKIFDGSLRNKLIETIGQIQEEEGRRVTDFIRDNNGRPDGETLTFNAKFCEDLEQMLRALQPSPT